MEREERPNLNLKVFGCGVSGTNIVQRIFELGIPGVQTLAVSEDARHLIEAKVNKKILTGMNLNRGLGGCGLETIESDLVGSDSYVRENLQGYNVAIITGGLGGRFSSVILGYVSRVAREINPDGIVIGLVTLPSSAEGKERKDNARYGLKKMTDACDTIIVISFDSLIKMYGEPWSERIFRIADEILKEIINRLIEVINKEIGDNRYDELREIFTKGKMGTFGIGECDDSASPIKKATEEALNSPLILGDLKEADTVIMMVIAGNDISVSEAQEAATIVKERIDLSATLKIYHFVDSNLKGDVRVIIVFLG